MRLEGIEMVTVVIKKIGDFEIQMMDDHTLFLSRPCYRIWVGGGELNVSDIVSAEIVVKKTPESDRLKVNKAVKMFEDTIDEHYRNQTADTERIKQVITS